ncbi:hypothetical protein FKG94_26610 [Exilibacterium tricleocarpae]|uniref:Uncharacterized protein n=1 Tax=Exilibacterium tricleocarpae TaxID=2591008 RepID=A0A545SPL5_9GAMM|nr:hypothetical protein [Exilibacterium tricleocarpae]TQV66928.1 hypothetical protein FKG94_26610 [Exilibacterium tricleocarpae]
MSELAKIKAKVAGELLQHFEVAEESQPFVQADVPPLACIQALAEHKCFNDAVKLIAHALPKREAVWWACLAARHGGGEAAASGDTAAALAAAENWVKEPSEANRQIAKKTGDKTGHKSAASWAATAAYWSTGSMAPDGEPAVPPPPYLYAHAVAGSVSLAAVLPDPDQAEEKFKRYITQGLDLANGGRGEVSG